MYVLRHTLWVILNLYIYALLPLVCNASTGVKDNWMEDDENTDSKYLLKLGRRLLDSKDEILKSTSDTNSTIYFAIYVTIFFLLVIIFIACCYKFANSDEDLGLCLGHPPPACPPVRPFTHTQAQSPIRLPSGSRPLAPPRTSTSLILLPEERHFDGLFEGMPNPVLDSYISDEERRRNIEPSTSHDLPPDYESAAKDTVKLALDAIDPPPKYCP